MDKCKHCGAPLPRSGKCEYCGSEHSMIENIDDVYYKINFHGTEHICYLGDVTVDTVSTDFGRRIDGTMEKPRFIQKFRFELVEV